MSPYFLRSCSSGIRSRTANRSRTPRTDALSRPPHAVQGANEDRVLQSLAAACENVACREFGQADLLGCLQARQTRGSSIQRSRISAVRVALPCGESTENRSIHSAGGRIPELMNASQAGPAHVVAHELSHLMPPRLRVAEALAWRRRGHRRPTDRSPGRAIARSAWRRDTRTVRR
jgi:hypothetical protein